MIWDRGTWEPESPDVDRALAKGDLKMRLHGRKLKGSWVLVRMRDRQWLLIKHRDQYASSTVDLTVARPRSVVSRRTMAGIAVSWSGFHKFETRGERAAPVSGAAPGV